jgi:hypothetical protein
MFMQTGFNLWLSSLFLTRGEYFKALDPLHWTSFGSCHATDCPEPFATEKVPPKNQEN